MSDQIQVEPTQEIYETDSESEYDTESELEIQIDEDQDGSQPQEFDDEEEIPEWAVMGEDDVIGHITDVVTSLFSTEEGDTVCSALVSISKQIETQNRIMVKILAHLQKST